MKTKNKKKGKVLSELENEEHKEEVRAAKREEKARLLCERNGIKTVDGSSIEVSIWFGVKPRDVRAVVDKFAFRNQIDKNTADMLYDQITMNLRQVIHVHDIKGKILTNLDEEVKKAKEELCAKLIEEVKKGIYIQIST